MRLTDINWKGPIRKKWNKPLKSYASDTHSLFLTSNKDIVINIIECCT